MSTVCESLREQGVPKLEFSDTKSEGSMGTLIVDGAPKVCTLAVRHKATLNMDSRQPSSYPWAPKLPTLKSDQMEPRLPVQPELLTEANESLLLEEDKGHSQPQIISLRFPPPPTMMSTTLLKIRKRDKKT